jgi:excisionase family DNA binding protein
LSVVRTIEPRVTTGTDEGEYCTVAEAARQLKVSVSTIWRWINAGSLTAYRVGPRRIRIKRKDLKALIRPARARQVVTATERSDIWAGYDPQKVNETLEKTAGVWADLDVEAVIADLYRAREAGTRPSRRP